MGAQSPYNPLLLSSESGIETTASGLPPRAAAAINRPQPPGTEEGWAEAAAGPLAAGCRGTEGARGREIPPDSGSPASAPLGTTRPAGTLEEPLQVRDLPWGAGSDEVRGRGVGCKNGKPGCPGVPSAWGPTMRSPSRSEQCGTG